jgi:hypothetical protein
VKTSNLKQFRNISEMLSAPIQPLAAMFSDAPTEHTIIGLTPQIVSFHAKIIERTLLFSCLIEILE